MSEVMTDQETTMAFRAHLKALKRTLIVCLISFICASVICFLFFDPIVEFLYAPFLSIENAGTEDTLFINNIFEGFLAKLKISLLSGLTLSFPIILFSVLRFVFPALSKKERRVILYTLIISAVLVLVGFYYSYYLILPITIDFFTSVGFLPDNVGILLNYQNNIIYIFKFIFMIMITFQFPVLMEMLMITNIVERKTLLGFSRYIIVGVFLLAAIITPPDFVSQCMIAFPMIFLYFLAILIAKIFGFGKSIEGKNGK
ncbi:MAG: twin-arginine translocase subunit TatC [Spirochaetales bacterium]|uniref:Sec-independent protein translocase protein TatC n=1 Tax=Candidatus Thalassospirochaeta sargassi TaxID=3119039 RepID=A0AAJ1ICF7_9SPIO|nr:twin-arginine translocase subunit TatC [Spirochaetales bacterium]